MKDHLALTPDAPATAAWSRYVHFIPILTANQAVQTLSMAAPKRGANVIPILKLQILSLLYGAARTM
jgi:hypothetical protein